MPIFEFDCKQCDVLVEEFFRSSKCTPPSCPDCGQPMTRKLSAPAIIFKGTGYYTTDYGKGRMIRDAEKKENSSNSSTEAKPSSTDSSTPAAKTDSSPAKPAGESSKPVEKKP